MDRITECCLIRQAWFFLDKVRCDILAYDHFHTLPPVFLARIIFSILVCVVESPLGLDTMLVARTDSYKINVSAHACVLRSSLPPLSTSLNTGLFYCNSSTLRFFQSFIFTLVTLQLYCRSPHSDSRTNS